MSMIDTLQSLLIKDFKTEQGKIYPSLPLSYELFGQPLGDSPVVLINHAMTANSTVTGDQGWWNSIVGDNKVINTNLYTVISFNVPGNGYDNYLIKNHTDFTVRDIARIFLKGLNILGVKKLFATIGGSIGGALVWEIGVISPRFVDYLIPIATDWKATDWILANIKIQSQILENSSDPLYDARMHAMNFYRTPQSYKAKFNRSINEEKNVFNIDSWLEHHGKKIKKRYKLDSYKLMNHLLSTIDITEGRGSFEQTVSSLKSSIHIIGINSDMFFISEENKETLQRLLKTNKKAFYSEINSIHGHDAFLIEFKQLENILKPIFQ